MITLGVDLSLTATGIAVLEDGKLLYRGVIRSKPVGKKPKDEIARINTIVEQVIVHIEKYTPRIVVLEGLAFMAKGTSLAQLSGLNYLVRQALYKMEIEFIIVAPSSLKKFITSRGNAQKDEMMLFVYKKYGVTILENNENDAYCLAQVGLALIDKERKITNIQKQVISLISSQI